MESFDPFSEWLGRPPGRPPEDHYELLGLARFEPDLDLISHTVDILRVKIRKVRPGSHLADWQRLLDRLDAAKICLSDPIAKAAYDDSIDTASHTLNVSGEPVVTWDSPAEGSEDAAPGEVSDTADAQIIASDQTADAAPSIVEAPPVVEDPDQGTSTVGSQMPTEAAFPAIRPRTRKRSRVRRATGSLLLSVVLLSVAIGLALLKQRRDAARTGQPPVTTPPTILPDVKPGEGTVPDPPAEDTAPNPPEPPTPAPSEVRPTPDPARPGPPKRTTPDMSDPPRPVVDPAGQHAFQSALTAVRDALARRDLEAAATRLNEAVSLSQTDEDRAEADQLEVLRAHVDAFWGSLREQIPRLESGSELQVGEMMVIVVEAGADFVVLRVTGQNRRYSFGSMPHVLAVAMAEQLFSNSANAKALRASFLIVEPDGDADQARRLLQEASQGGAQVDELLAELNRS